PSEMPRSTEVLVIGLGLAGREAAEAATEAGASVVGIDRGAGATVVGLSPNEDGGWVVLVQTAAGSAEIGSAAVIVATGAYFEPREHRAIAGGRPAGVMTGDLAWQLVRHGLRPGRVVALVGGPGDADHLAAAMVDAGAHVIRLADAPDALRGEVRLEAVRAEDRWLAADTLVLADRLLPQAFVLRGLGLTDARPGVPAPADGDGRLPLEGLWAVGCCVNPSLDHRTCVEQGRLVGRGAARAVAPSKHLSADRPVATH
ncbi:MAG TPA: hypothetical protein VIF44_05465, partial [Candidatus Limnocylindrales bacterium]